MAVGILFVALFPDKTVETMLLFFFQEMANAVSFSKSCPGPMGSTWQGAIHVDCLH